MDKVLLGELDRSFPRREGFQSPENLSSAERQLIEHGQEIYNQMLNEHPNHPELRLKAAMITRRLGGIYSSIRKFDQAIAHYDRAITLLSEEVNPPIKEFPRCRALALTYRSLGFALLQTQEKRRAKSCFEEVERYASQAIKLKPEDAGAYLYRGFAHLNLKQHDQALRDFTKSAELDGNIEAMRFAGVIHRLRGETEQALKWFSNALQKEPGNYRTLYMRAAVYLRRKQYELAAKDCRAAIGAGVRPIRAWEYLGTIRRNQGKPQQAVNALTSALALDPDNGCCLVERGSSKLDMDKVAEAKADFERAVKLVPDNPFAHNGYGWSLLRSDKAKESIAPFTEAIKLNPRWTSAYRGRAMAYERTGEDQKAQADREQAKNTPR